MNHHKQNISNTSTRIGIVGAGWAGLACAIELTNAGQQITIYESARQIGGRARALNLDGQRLDNGQHLLVGAYTETLRLMRDIGADPNTLFTRARLCLDFPAESRKSHSSHFRLSLPKLPAPLHLALGLLMARGATLSEKIMVARFMQGLKAQNYKLTHDCTVSEWLDKVGQTGTLRQFLWEPLCLAALNTAPQIASAQVFANVLRDSLGGKRAATDLLLPKSDLSSVFPRPAADFIIAKGGEIRLSSRISQLDRVDGSTCDNKGWKIKGEHFEHIVLAVAPQHIGLLLAKRHVHTQLLAGLADYHYEPIATAYLGFPTYTIFPPSLSSAMVGLSGPLGQWVFDRGRTGDNPGVLACVLSANGDWDALEDNLLVARLHDELSAALGPLPPLLWHRVIRERRATFSCQPKLHRPGAKTVEPGLWLAGDYTYADYPATIEGAVRSGIAAAHAILNEA